MVDTILFLVFILSLFSSFYSFLLFLLQLVMSFSLAEHCIVGLIDFTRPRLFMYRVSGNFVSVLQNLMPEAIPGQECHRNMGPVLNVCGDTSI